MLKKGRGDGSGLYKVQDDFGVKMKGHGKNKSHHHCSQAYLELSIWYLLLDSFLQPLTSAIFVGNSAGQLCSVIAAGQARKSHVWNCPLFACLLLG